MIGYFSKLKTLLITSHTQHHLTHPKYRPDIDGLRAIAILFVIAFHAFPSWVKGGFIGVDIFFVISGYLISTIIIGSLERNSFSFIEFYKRRIQRIFPALLLILVACYVFGWFALLAPEYKQLGKHIAGGAGFVSNFLLYIERGYFDNPSDTKPLLHLWSLGIEEQFYITWPILLWLAWKRNIKLLTCSIIISAISFALNISIAHNHSVAAFLWPATRFWELLTGAILSHITLRNQHIFPKFQQSLGNCLGQIVQAHAPAVTAKMLRNFKSLLGVALIVVGVLVITKERHFPGWWALLPTLGTVLIISAGAQAWLNRAILSNRVLVGVGLISYPLYLWHWPLLSFANILEGGTPSNEMRIAAMCISFILAWLTYWLIEKPIRFGKNSKVTTIMLLILMVVTGYVGYKTDTFNGYIYRYTKSGSKYAADGNIVRPIEANITSCPSVPGVVASWCRKTGTATVALLGDSHADQLMAGFIQSGNSKFNRLISLGAGNCHPSLGEDRNSRCVKQIAAALDLVVSDNSIEYVILTAWNANIGNMVNDFIEGYGKTFEILRKHKKKIVYVIDYSTLKAPPRACIESSLGLRNKLQKRPKFCDNAAQDDFVPMNKYNELVEELKKQNPDILIYNPFFCISGICKVRDESFPYYANEGHLTHYGTQLLVDDLIKNIEKYFPK